MCVAELVERLRLSAGVQTGGEWGGGGGSTSHGPLSPSFLTPTNITTGS